MRKVVMMNLVSLDGFFAGPRGEIDWHNVDEEFNQAAVDMIQRFDTILFGRVTYKLFEDYWPNAASDPKISREDRIIANRINEMTKVVFSKSLKKVTWDNSQLFRGNVEGEVKRLKQEDGRDIVIYGSGSIVRQLTDAGLIDEYQFMVNPVVLSNGKSLFKDLKGKIDLKLVSTRPFKGGNVLLTYEPKSESAGKRSL
jgi:dihydrofolate reductase